MRILHFMNIPLSVEELRSGGRGISTSGGWLAALLGRMVRDTDHTFACVAFGNVKEIQTSHDDRVACFVVPGDLTGSSQDSFLRMCCDVVRQWRPELLHIHGTEAAYGLLSARTMVDCPALISLQGLMGPYSQWQHFFGNRSLMEIIKMHRWLEIPLRRGLWAEFRRCRKLAQRESEIMRGNRFFMGRTAWDRAYVSAMSPEAEYFHGGELLREPFWQSRWDIGQVRRHRIIFSNAGHPRKGIETLLDAVQLLRAQFRDLEVGIAGSISKRSGYGRHVRCRIAALNHIVHELGPLSAEEMVRELVTSHVFVSPSLIDNSPNSICEAQLLGMPVISTYTGGVPSLIEDGRTGLFFPVGDVPMLAARLRTLFEHDKLAVDLGRQAREEAIRRHDPGVIVHDVVAAYENIVGRQSWNKSTNASRSAIHGLEP